MAKFRICSIPGCGKKHEAKGWCNTHYLRWHKHGDPTVILRDRPPSHRKGEARKFLETTVISFAGSDCLPWPYGRKGGGYGGIRYKGERMSVHRLVCELVHGTPPSPEMYAAHSCGNRICCNPNHLRWATPQENSDDRIIHGTDCRGSRSPSARLSEDDVKSLRELKGHLPYRKLGEIFGISASCAQRAAVGKSWTGSG